MKKFLKYYFLINTLAFIIVAFLSPNQFLLPSAMLAGVSFFGYIMIVTDNCKLI